MKSTKVIIKLLIKVKLPGVPHSIHHLKNTNKIHFRKGTQILVYNTQINNSLHQKKIHGKSISASPVLGFLG